MADRLSDIDLYEGLTKRGDLRDAILDPVTSGETFVNEVALSGAGAIRNISNLLGNVPDVLLEGRDSAAFKNTKKVLEDRTKGDADRILDLLKVPFRLKLLAKVVCYPYINFIYRKIRFAVQSSDLFLTISDRMKIRLNGKF